MYQAKKLAVVLATFISVTTSLKAHASVQALEALQQVSYIWYRVWFQEDQPIRALINSGSEVNAMTPAYAAKLGLTTWKTSIGAQKIDGLPLETYNMASLRFLLQDSLGRVRFFEETFLLGDTNMEVILGMLFLAFNNADIQFGTEKLTWRFYTITEALSTSSWVELIDKTGFAKATLDENSKTFVMHVAILEATTIHPSRVA